MIYKTAADALSSGVPGAKTLQCKLREALKMVGKKTTNVEGIDAWFGLPINQTPQTAFDDPNGIWNVPLGFSGKDVEMKGLELFYRQHPEITTTTEKLEAAIAAVDTSSLPGIWTAEARDDGDAMLIWTCAADKVLYMQGDEPWSKWGGNAIIKAAGIGDYNDHKSGTDAYQDRFGDSVVTQWVYFSK